MMHNQVNMTIKTNSYFLAVFFVLILEFLTSNTVFGHGVYGGISGCPVGACEINDWGYLKFMQDITFQFTLIIYALILGVLLISGRHLFIAKIRKKLKT
jgi:hypothetical protein